MALHTYIPQLMSLQRINILQLVVSEIQSGQTNACWPKQMPADPDTMGENNTCTALKAVGFNIGTTFSILPCIDNVYKYEKVELL